MWFVAEAEECARGAAKDVADGGEGGEADGPCVAVLEDGQRSVSDDIADDVE
jgi:hypothetical protein